MHTVECTNVEPVFPCYVVEGVVTVYSSSKLNAQSQEQVRDAIRESIENGNLEGSDNRFLGVTWRGHVGGGGEGGDNGGGGGDNGGGGNNGGGGDHNGGNGEIERPDTRGGGLEPWAYAIIAIGGGLILTLLLFCFRRPGRRVDVAEDDNNGGNNATANAATTATSKRSNHHSESDDNDDSGEDDESESVHDVYVDNDYDDSRATPLIQNTSTSRRQALSDESIEEEEEEEEDEDEASEEDMSYENLKSPLVEEEHDYGGVSNSYHSYGNSQVSEYERESLQSHSLGSEPVEYQVPGYSYNSQRPKSLPEDLVADTGKESPSAIFGSKDNKEYKYTDKDTFVESNDRVPDTTMEETSDSAYSSYEDVVEEEYEVEYLEEDTTAAHRNDGTARHWTDDHVDEDDDMANSADASVASSSLPILAHSAQLGKKSSFDSMRKKWENAL